MSASLSRVNVPAKTWVDIYASASIVVGTRIIVQNTGRDEAVLSESEFEPTSLVGHNVLLKNEYLISGKSPIGAWVYSRLGTKLQIEENLHSGFKPFSSVNSVEEPLSKAAFGDLLTINPTPIIQITAQYGLLDDILTASIGGTTTAADSKFITSSGLGANNVAAIVTAREAQYRPGQGLTCRLTTIFGQGVVDNIQQAGFVNSESALGFGYNGTEFGIIYAKDGQQEIEELTVTAGASSSGNATVTLDGTSYIVALTSGSIQKTAFEICDSLRTQVNGYVITSNSGVVTVVAILPELGQGSFSYSAGTTGSAASWAEIKNGILPTETWIKKEDWNVNPYIDIDPTLGNVYQIQLQYGFSAIKFYIENPDTGDFELVHIIKYANTTTDISISNPTFRAGWVSRDLGNIPDVTIQGSSVSVFIEGEIVYDGPTKGLCANSTGIGTTSQNIISLRNRITFNGKVNRASIIPAIITLATDSGKSAIFDVLVNPTVGVGDFIDWGYFNETTSLMEVATNTVAITGDPVACFVVKASSSVPIDMVKLLENHPPGSEFSVSARVTSGNASDMDVSITWKEDL